MRLGRCDPGCQYELEPHGLPNKATPSLARHGHRSGHSVPLPENGNGSKKQAAGDSSNAIGDIHSMARPMRCPLRTGDGTGGRRKADTISIASYGEVAMHPLGQFPKAIASALHRLALPAVAAAALIGGSLVAEPRASAQLVAEAPPLPRVEVVPRTPSPAFVWAPGYWGYRPSRGYAWYGGRWQIGRPGYAWASPHWAARGGGRWGFAPGRWVRR